jgi:hypothetical protein
VSSGVEVSLGAPSMSNLTTLLVSNGTGNAIATGAWMQGWGAMGQPWGSHGAAMGQPWGSHGAAMGQPWGSHGAAMGQPWGPWCWCCGVRCA